MESRDKLVVCNAYQDHVSELESLREQMSVAGMQDIESSSESHKLVWAG